MLAEDLNLVGYSAIVGCVGPSYSRDQNAFMLRDYLTL